MLLSALMKKGWNQIRMWREIAHERRELRRLSEAIAKDIGISRAEAEREADRPFWDYGRAPGCSMPHGQTTVASRHARCVQAR